MSKMVIDAYNVLEMENAAETWDYLLRVNLESRKVNELLVMRDK